MPSKQERENFIEKMFVHREELDLLGYHRMDVIRAAQVLRKVHVDIVDDVDYVTSRWLDRNAVLSERCWDLQGSLG